MGIMKCKLVKLFHVGFKEAAKGLWPTWQIQVIVQRKLGFIKKIDKGENWNC